MARRRDSLLLLDTAIASITNAGALYVSARFLTPGALGDLAFVLVTASASVALQRAGLLTPALTTQRESGQLVIPLRWGLMYSSPIAIAIGVISAGLLALMSRDEGAASVWFLPSVLLAFAFTVQDLVRRAAFTMQAPASAVVSSGIALLGSSLGFALAVMLVPGSPSGIALGIAGGYLSGATAILPTLVGRSRTLSSVLGVATARSAWRYGRWSGLDSLMSQTAMIIPMVVATSQAGSLIIASYRVLQVAIGPLNIAATTVVSSFGLDAWMYNSREGIASLSRRVWRMTALLTGGGAVYMAVSSMAAIVLAGLNPADVMRIAIIVFICGVLTGATAAPQAGALVLGQQAVGVYIRVTVLAASISFSALPADILAAVALDPIGATALFAASVTFVGWAVTYRVTSRRM